jgi:hypothetical protein
MSVQFSTGSDFLDIASVIDINAAYTVSLWINMDSLANFPVPVDLGGISLFDYIATSNANSGHIEVDCSIGGASTGTANLSTGTWYFIALRRNSTTSLDGFVTNAVDANVADNVGARGAGSKTIIGQFDATNNFVGMIAQVRIWTRALTNGELATEKASATMVSTTNAWAEYRLATSGTATVDSFSTNTLTSHGSLTTGASDPPGQGGGGAAGLMWL